MPKFTLSWISGLLAVACPLAAQERIAALPGEDSSSTKVSLFSVGKMPDATMSISLPQGIFKAVATPSGRVLFLSNSDAISYLTVTDAAGGILPGFEKLPIGPKARTMLLTPTGDKLLVLASTLYTFDISIGGVVARGPITESNYKIVAPLDVAVSHDGRRAFIVTTDRKLHAINLETNAVVGTIEVGPNAFGVTVGPNGLVYVACYNALFEVEGGSEGGPMAVRSIIALPYDTYAGRPVFTPSGRHILVPNRTGSGPIVTAYDLAEQKITRFSLSGGSGIAELCVASENVFFGITNGVVYKGDLSLGILVPARFANDSAIEKPIASLAVSHEIPEALTFLMANQSGDVWEVDLQAGAVQRKIAANPILNPIWTGKAGMPARIVAFNERQIAASASRTLPVVVRAIGTDGRPVTDVPVSWSAAGFDISAMSKTNVDGYAQAVLVAPATPWTYTASARVGALSQNFAIVVGAGADGGESLEGVHILRGNGELLTPFRLVPPHLEVVVRDAEGNAVPEAEIVWTVGRSDGGTDEGAFLRVISGDTRCTPVSGQATGRQVTCITGENGQSIIEFAGGNSGTSPAVYSVVATSGEHSVKFFETIMPSGQGTLPELALTIDRPAAGSTITAPLGVAQRAAMQISVYENSGGSVRTLPHVAVDVQTPNEPANGPTAYCAGGPVLTNGQGVAVCDVVGGGRLGSDRLTVTIGGVASRAANIRINVTPGPATTIVIKGGDNQFGTPGQQLPIPLLAEMKDANGNPVQYADTTFEVVKGSAAVPATSKKSDAYGRVSTVLTLGAMPGDVEVLVKSGLAQATFKATVKGPALSKSTFLNGASFVPGIPLGGIVTVQAKGMLFGAPEIPSGECVSQTDATGKLPTRLANMEFQFAGVLAPIFSVCNVGENQGQVNLQLPWEVPAGAVDLKVRTGMGTESAIEVAVPGAEVLSAMPGVFQWFTEGKTIAVANRQNGTVVTPSAPARAGEKLRIFATGLGPVVPSAKTNEFGVPGQQPMFTPVVVLGGVGAGEVTSVYAQGMLSIFSVDFTVPAVPAGDLKLKLGVQTAADTVVQGPEVILPVAQ